MSKEKNFKYENIYPKNPETGNNVIEIVLEDYMVFFHEWDNATFRKRGMHPELVEFLNTCSEDIPLKNKIEINFCIKHGNQDKDKENLIIGSYKNYFAFYNRIKEKKIKEHFIRALILALISIGLLLANKVFTSVVDKTLWISLISDGLTIGGWVSMWEALNIVTSQRHVDVMRNKEIKRLLEAPISFEYIKDCKN